MKKERQLEMATEHPVSDVMRLRVMQELTQIEEQYNVKVLYACESGSRGWGFASSDSDYDVRFIYTNKVKWYFQVESGRDVIERPLDDELDINGWELRKSLGLLKRGNSTLFEWLDSPIVYYKEPDFFARFDKLKTLYFSEVRARYHYLSMAKKNFSKYLQGEEVRYKKYLYVLRPILATLWITSGLGQAPTRFSSLLALIEDKAVLDEIEKLLAIKRTSTESDRGTRFPVIHQFIEQQLENLAINRTELESIQCLLSNDALNDLLYETVFRYNKVLT